MEDRKFEKGVVIGAVGGIFGTLGIQYAIKKVTEYYRRVEIEKCEKLGEVVVSGVENLLDRKLLPYLRRGGTENGRYL